MGSPLSYQSPFHVHVIVIMRLVLRYTESIRKIMDVGVCKVLDGGLATEVERKGFNLHVS